MTPSMPRDGAPFFNPSFGNRPLRIVGRERELNAIRAGLSGAPGSELRALMVTGQRSYGKTALLVEIESMASELGFVCASVTVNRSMLQNVLDGLQLAGADALRQRTTVDGLTVGALGFTLGVEVTRALAEVSGFQAKLGVIVDRLESKGLGACILVDEVQPNSEELRELTQAYQYLAGRGHNIALIMAGLPRCVSKVLNDKVSTFLYRAERIDLGSLINDDIFLYFAQAFPQMGIVFEEGAMMDAVRATGGAPYLMQLVGRNIAMLAPADGFVSHDIVDQAIELAREKFFRNVCMPCLDTMSLRDIAFCRAMLEDSGPSHASELKLRLGMTDEDYQQTRRRNIDNGIIVARGYGVVEFAMPLFAEFLREEG